jgi:hypothetical protein
MFTRRQADDEIAMQLRQCAAEQGQEIGQGKKSGKILKISKSYARHLAETLRCQKEGPMLQHTGPRLMRNKAAKALARYDQRGKL